MTPARPADLGCPSTDHGGEVVDATVPGWFRNPYNHDQDARTTYCDRCARLLAMVHLFEPDADLYAVPSSEGADPTKEGKR